MSFIEEVIDIFLKYKDFFFRGIINTLIISLIGTVVGLLIGLITGIITTIPKSKNNSLRFIQKFINLLIKIYVEVFRGTPMMVQSMVIFWGYAFANNGNTLPLIPAGILIVSINTGAYMSEIVRGGIISIDKGQFEGAYSLGLNHFKTMIYVIIPQVFRNILPSLSNEFVINIKDTSVLNVIGVSELYFYANKVSKMTWAIFETYLIICVLYFILTFTITSLLRLVERKMDGKKEYIFGSQSYSKAEITIDN